MKAIVTLREKTNSPILVDYSFKTIRLAVEFAKFQCQYKFSSPLTFGLNSYYVAVNRVDGKNVFFKQLNK